MLSHTLSLTLFVLNFPEGGELIPQSFPPIRKQMSLKHTGSWGPALNVNVFDFGQNMAGILKVCTYTHTQRERHRHTQRHTQRHTHICAHICKRNTHAHTCTHTHTHFHSHIHTHTQEHTFFCFVHFHHCLTQTVSFSLKPSPSLSFTLSL